MTTTTDSTLAAPAEAGACGRSSPAKGSAPRVRTIEKSRHGFYGTYKGHTLDLSRENAKDDWNINVTDERGCYAYCGVWRDSAGKSRREAILEALRGSLLWPNTAVRHAEDGAKHAP